MKYFLVTFHETDGNDAIVYDTIVSVDPQADVDLEHVCSAFECETCKDAAFGKVADLIEQRLQENGQSFESDGEFGFYFSCDEDCVQECEHGGIVIRTAETFETLESAQAEQDRTFYHSKF